MKLLVLFSVLKRIVRHPLNRSRPLRALLAFARWQAGTRILRQSVAFPWVDKSRLLAGAGNLGLTDNYYSGLSEYSDMAFLLHVLRPDDCFVDVGANRGSYTVLAAAVVGARTLAFEPIPETFKGLTDQINLNGVASLVEARNIGVASKPGNLVFVADQDATSHVLRPDHAGANAAESTKLPVDSLDNCLSPGHVYVLKIDVEGFEHDVIMGSRRILESGDIVAIIIELRGHGAHYGFSDAATHELLLKFGYAPYTYNPLARVLTKLPDFDLREWNTIYVKDEPAVAQRLRDAPYRTVHPVRKTL